MMKERKISDSSGFSFAELMIVLAIIGVLAAMGLPSFLRGLPEKRLRNATRNLYADLQRARLVAVKGNRNVTVTFDTAVGEYFFPDESGDLRRMNWSENQDLNADDVRYGCGITGKDWRNGDIPPAGITGPITFNNLGGIGIGESDIYLQSQNDQTVCYAVTVSPLGVVKIFQYSDSVWK